MKSWKRCVLVIIITFLLFAVFAKPGITQEITNTSSGYSTLQVDVGTIQIIDFNLCRASDNAKMNNLSLDLAADAAYFFYAVVRLPTSWETELVYASVYAWFLNGVNGTAYNTSALEGGNYNWYFNFTPAAGTTFNWYGSALSALSGNRSAQSATDVYIRWNFTTGDGVHGRGAIKNATGVNSYSWRMELRAQSTQTVDNFVTNVKWFGVLRYIWIGGVANLVTGVIPVGSSGYTSASHTCNFTVNTHHNLSINISGLAYGANYINNQYVYVGGAGDLLSTWQAFAAGTGSSNWTHYFGDTNVYKDHRAHFQNASYYEITPTRFRVDIPSGTIPGTYTCVYSLRGYVLVTT